MVGAWRDARGRGEALLLERDRQVAVRVLAAPEEDALITTAAAALLARATARRAAHRLCVRPQDH